MAALVFRCFPEFTPTFSVVDPEFIDRREPTLEFVHLLSAKNCHEKERNWTDHT